MIEKLEIENKCKIEKLTRTFSHYFDNFDVNRQIESNKFTEIFIISDDEENILGFIILDTIYERMELIQIEVDKAFQNRGYASKLLQFMIDEAVKRNMDNITLEVCEDNFIAIHLYEKFGFVKVAIRKNYYHDKDGILMERKMM